MNVTEVIDRHAATQGTKPVIFHDSGAWTWAQLRSYVDATAATLASAGVKDGDIVGHLFHNELLKVLVCLATARLGATTVSISVATPLPKCQRILQDVGASQLLTDLADLGNKFTTSIFLLNFYTLNLEDNSASLLKLNPKGLLLIIEGSGTTGTPKYIPITHEVMVRRSEDTAQVTSFDCNDRFYNLMKFDFLAAKQRFFDGLYLAASFWIPVNEAVDLRKAALASQYNVLFGTVFHIEKYLARLGEGVSDYLSPLKAISLGGSSVSSNLRMRIRTRLCPRLEVRNGANEFGLISITSFDDVYTAEGGVGRLLPGRDIEILDNSGKVVPDGEPGVLRVKGDVCTSGYWNNPKATALSFKDGWFYPGDICLRDEDGLLIYLGRSDDLMIRNGINIYPRQVEAALLQHCDVLEAHVFPMADPIQQDVPVAMVVSKNGLQTSETALLKMVREDLGAHTLSRVFLAEAMPRNDRGKIPAAVARKMIEDHVTVLEICASRANSIERKKRNQNR
jgi:cyanophycin synthetase